MNLSEKNISEKSQTIKIDIRSMGYARTPSTEGWKPEDKTDYFSQLDPHFFFDHAYDAIVLADLHGKVLNTNTRAVQFFGYTDSEMLGTSMQTLVAGVTESLLDQIRSVVTEKQRYIRIQAFAHHKDNSYSAVEIVVLGNGKKTPEAPTPICYLIRDTQSRWEAEQNLLSAYHAMDNTDAGIGIAGLDCNFIYSNRALTALLAPDNDERVVGHSMRQWFDQQTVIAPMLEKISKGEPWSGEQRLLRGEKSAWLLISAVPDLDEDNELTGIVLSIRDLAERRRAEMAEQRVERNRALMESLSPVCHALGQPATVLLTSIEILKQGNIDEETRKQMLDMSYDAILELRGCLQELNAKRRCGDKENLQEK